MENDDKNKQATTPTAENAQGWQQQMGEDDVKLLQDNGFNADPNLTDAQNLSAALKFKRELLSGYGGKPSSPTAAVPTTQSAPKEKQVQLWEQEIGKDDADWLKAEGFTSNPNLTDAQNLAEALKFRNQLMAQGSSSAAPANATTPAPTTTSAPTTTPTAAPTPTAAAPVESTTKKAPKLSIEDAEKEINKAGLLQTDSRTAIELAVRHPTWVVERDDASGKYNVKIPGYSKQKELDKANADWLKANGFSDPNSAEARAFERKLVARHNRPIMQRMEADSEWGKFIKAKQRGDAEMADIHLQQANRLREQAEREKKQRKANYVQNLSAQASSALSGLAAEVEKVKSSIHESSGITLSDEKTRNGFGNVRNEGGHYYIDYVMPESALNQGNAAMATNGGRRGIKRMMASVEVDEYGNPIRDPNTGRAMNITFRTVEADLQDSSKQKQSRAFTRDEVEQATRVAMGDLGWDKEQIENALKSRFDGMTAFDTLSESEKHKRDLAESEQEIARQKLKNEAEKTAAEERISQSNLEVKKYLTEMGYKSGEIDSIIKAVSNVGGTGLMDVSKLKDLIRILQKVSSGSQVEEETPKNGGSEMDELDDEKKKALQVQAAQEVKGVGTKKERPSGRPQNQG